MQLWRTLVPAGLAVVAMAVAPASAISEDAKARVPHIVAPASEEPQLPPMDQLAFGELLVRQRCANCHGIEPGVTSLAAPLVGVFGRKAGSAPGYTFSPNIQNLGIAWTPQALDGWLAATTFDTPDIRMRHVGLPQPDQRAAVIAYLGSLPGNR
ncbi:MAG: c-type cytochrome [Hyphomicrobiaceae bacterium]|nr:c-type cytochrome [Hyphomicrobiaceae bacterium]